MAKLTDLRKKKREELISMLGTKKADLMKVSLEILQKKEKNVKKPRHLRVEIAQIKTILKESKNEESN